MALRNPPWRTMTDSRGLFDREAHNTDAADDHRLWLLGHSFGGFRVVCPLASGGMAGVYLARKEGPACVSIHAALKLVHPHLVLEREFVDMFLDEARIAASVHHANVCRVLDFGRSAGTYYLAMEYVLGETWSKLRSALARHPEGRAVLPAVAAHVMTRACEGLHAAHRATDERGAPLAIVHRDVSPQNIFIAYDGSVRVLDFGIARAADRITHTREGMRKGRFAYMSPEQVLGDPLASTSDIWSLGVVLREALEGKRLFYRQSETATLFAVASEPLPAWSVEVPAPLRAVVDRALQRAPSARYANAQEMALDLTRFAPNDAAPIDVAALSYWMNVLFKAELERKRALLQLPVPAPRRRTGRTPAIPLAQRTRDLTEVVARWVAQCALSRWSRWAIGAALALLCGVCIGLLARDGRGALFRRTHASKPIGTEPRTSEARAQTIAASVTVLPPTAPLFAPDLARLASEWVRPTELLPTTSASDPAVSEHAAPLLDLDPARAPPPLDAPRSMRAGAIRSPGTLLVGFRNGWAEVYLKDRLLGTTPGRFVLPPGEQTLTIKPFGTGRPFRKQTRVRAGAITKLFLASEAW